MKNDMKTQLFNQIVLMSPPDYFGLEGPDEAGKFENALSKRYYKEFMDDPQRFRERATIQWHGLKETVEAALNVDGISTGAVVELPAHRDMMNLVFTADPVFTLATPNITGENQRILTIASHFANANRSQEVDYTLEFLKNLQAVGNTGIIKARHAMEGTGDNVYDRFRDVIWSGYRDPLSGNAEDGRSDVRMHRNIKKLTGVSVNSMMVQKPWFHIDTCMAPLPTGHILAFMDGMTDQAKETLMREGFERFGMDPKEFLIEVSEEDALNYACNFRQFADTVVMADVSDDLKRQLETTGNNMVYVDVGQFIKGGGAVHCLTNTLNEPRVVGGTCRDYGYDPLELAS